MAIFSKEDKKTSLFSRSRPRHDQLREDIEAYQGPKQRYRKEASKSIFNTDEYEDRDRLGRPSEYLPYRDYDKIVAEDSEFKKKVERKEEEIKEKKPEPKAEKSTKEKKEEPIKRSGNTYGLGLLGRKGLPSFRSEPLPEEEEEETPVKKGVFSDRSDSILFDEQQSGLTRPGREPLAPSEYRGPVEEETEKIREKGKVAPSVKPIAVDLPKPTTETQSQALQEMQKQLDKLEGVLPPTTMGRAFYEQLRADAKEAYQDEKNRNRWLDVAETIGNALVQFGAAKTGGSRADMSNLRLSKTDWDARIGQAMEEYKSELSDIGRRAQEEDSAIKDYNDRLEKLNGLRLKFADLADANRRFNLQRQDQALDRAERNQQRAIQNRMDEIKFQYRQEQDALDRQERQLDREDKKALQALKFRTDLAKNLQKGGELGEGEKKLMDQAIKAYDNVVADDSSANREVLAASLQRLGYDSDRIQSVLDAPGIAFFDETDENREELIRELGQRRQGAQPSAPPRSIVKKEYSKSRDATRITYSDGTIEIVSGKQ